MKVFKAIVVFLLLLMMSLAVTDFTGNSQWVSVPLLLASGTVAIAQYWKDRLPHWSWIVVWLFTDLAMRAASSHPMHTNMTETEHYLRCYGAAFGGPFGFWILPCCHIFPVKWYSVDFLLTVLPVILLTVFPVMITAPLYWKRRSRPFRILFALSLCWWLFCGLGALSVWK